MGILTYLKKRKINKTLNTLIPLDNNNTKPVSYLIQIYGQHQALQHLITEKDYEIKKLISELSKTKLLLEQSKNEQQITQQKNKPTLTKTEKILIDFIKQNKLPLHDYAPYIANHPNLNIKTKSTAYRIVQSLKDKGLLIIRNNSYELL